MSEIMINNNYFKKNIEYWFRIYKKIEEKNFKNLKVFFLNKKIVDYRVNITYLWINQN